MSPRTAPVTAVALMAGTALLLSACATSKGTPGAPSGTAPATGGTITWAYDQELSTYNTNTTEGNAVANRVILGPVLSGFWEFRPDGTLSPNADFGTYRKVSDNPLTVEYTINPKATWSDGQPVNCSDLVLAWLTHSGVTGKKGFSAARTAGYEDMSRPACLPADRKVTVTYTKKFADWAAMFGPTDILPAHILEKQAGLTRSIVEYAATPDSPDLAKAVEFYNKGWTMAPGQLKKDLMPSSGPYVLDSWTAGQSLTLKANPKWWGAAPRTGTIILRFIGAPAQAQALQNGEIQAMDPQPQTDIVRQLKAMGDTVQFSTGNQYTFEHLDFNFRGPFVDRTLREAFARCVPRQQIVDNLIKPQNPDAQVLQSRFVFPFQPAYSAFSALGGEKYATADVAGAKQLLAGRTPTVRIGWKKDPDKLNKRRADTLALIQASCGKAGFKVVDAGTPTFFEKEAPAGNFDVAMFAWTGSPLLSDASGIYTTNGGQNAGRYSNKKVDALFKEALAETDRTRQTAALKQMDAILWKDLVTIPLFTFPSVFATAKTTQGLEFNATQANLLWNVSSWSMA